MAEEAKADITVVIEGDTEKFSYSDLGVEYNSTPEEIMEAVYEPILEKYGVNIKDIYVVNKGTKSETVTVYPKSPAGQ